jgi:hypothetical protein
MLVTNTTDSNRVSDGETLYRSVWQKPECLAKYADGTLHISAAAFDDRAFQISLFRHDLCEEPPHSNPPRMSQTDFVLALLASRIREQKLTVGEQNTSMSLDVLPDTAGDQHSSHAVVHPSLTINKNAFRKLRVRMAEIVEKDWPIKPDPDFIAALPIKTAEQT